MSASTSYIHPTALAALDQVFRAANLRPVIVQTQGAAVQSAGTHSAAGKYLTRSGTWHEYSACIDFSVNQPATRLSDGKKIVMDEKHINWFLEIASEFGFGGWHRVPSEGFTAAHMHLICSMVPFKHPDPQDREIVIHQMVDFVTGKSGLKGHQAERYWHASDANDKHCAHLFVAANPDLAGRIPASLRN